jgi:hypothetical protein
MIKPSAFVAPAGLFVCVRVRPRREEGEQRDGDEVAEAGLRPVHAGDIGRPNKLTCSRRCVDRRYARLHPDKLRAKESRIQQRRRLRAT